MMTILTSLARKPVTDDAAFAAGAVTFPPGGYEVVLAR